MRRVGVLGGFTACLLVAGVAGALVPIDPKLEVARTTWTTQVHAIQPVAKVATPAMFNQTATTLAAQHPGAIPTNIGKLATSSVLLRQHIYFPPGAKIPTTLTSKAAFLTPAAPTATTTGTTSGSSSGGSSTSSQPAPVTCSTCGAGVAVQNFEPVTAMSVTGTNADGTPNVQNCTSTYTNQGNCSALHVGDVITVVGSGFSNLSHQASLFFLGTWQSFDITVTNWSDTFVQLQVPMNLHGLGSQQGIISLGAPNCACDATAWTFTWVPTMVTQNLSFDPKQYPPGLQIFNSSYNTFALTNRTLGEISWGVWSSSYSGTGDSQSDSFFVAYPNNPNTGFTLRHGWTVTGSSNPWNGSSFPGSGPVTENAPTAGSTNPATIVSWAYSGGGYVSYQLSIQVQGEMGTSPTCNSPVDPVTGAVQGTCQN